MVWGIWLPSIALLAVAACFAWRDPRTMRTAVFLLAGLSLAGLTLFGVIMGQASTVDDPDDLTAAWVLLGMLEIALASVLILAVVLVVNGVVLVRREGRSPAHLLSLAMGTEILASIGRAVLALVGQLEIVAVAIVLLGFPLMYLSFVFTAFVTYSALYLLLDLSQPMAVVLLAMLMMPIVLFIVHLTVVMGTRAPAGRDSVPTSVLGRYTASRDVVGRGLLRALPHCENGSSPMVI